MEQHLPGGQRASPELQNQIPGGVIVHQGVPRRTMGILRCCPFGERRLPHGGRSGKRVTDIILLEPADTTLRSHCDGRRSPRQLQRREVAAD